jgi:hypothetical protein
MLPSFCEGLPSGMSPSEWWLVLFPTLPTELSQENGKRGSNGEKETQGVFWRMGFTKTIESYRQETGVQMENGVHCLTVKKINQRSFRGFKKSKKYNNPQRSANCSSVLGIQSFFTLII